MSEKEYWRFGYVFIGTTGVLITNRKVIDEMNYQLDYLNDLALGGMDE